MLQDRYYDENQQEVTPAKDGRDGIGIRRAAFRSKLCQEYLKSTLPHIWTAISKRAEEKFPSTHKSAMATEVQSLLERNKAIAKAGAELLHRKHQ